MQLNTNNTNFNLRRLKEEVRSFEHTTGQVLTLRNYLDNFDLDIRMIFKTPGSWARLKKLAGKTVPGFNEKSKYTKLLEGGLARLYHTNSYDYLTFLQSVVSNGFKFNSIGDIDKKFIKLFYYTIWLNPIEKVNKEFGTSFGSIEEAINSLSNYNWFTEELLTLITLRLEEVDKTSTKLIEIVKGRKIELYSCYSADEIHLLLEDKLGRWQPVGTQYNKENKFALVFVTLNKSDKEYAPSTLYKDYPISKSQFHWQSMNQVQELSREGQRIIKQKENGWKYILFARESKKDEFGLTNGYYCLGTMDFNSSHGECPMNVVWDMHYPIPNFILEVTKGICSEK